MEMRLDNAARSCSTGAMTAAPASRPNPASIRSLLLALGLLLAAVAGNSAQASCAGPHPVGELSRTWQDPQRGNRTVGALVRYPREAGTASAPAIEGCAFPVLAVGHGFTIPADRYDYLVDGLVPGGVIVVLPTTESGLSPDHAAFGADLAFVTRALAADPAFAAAAGALRGVVGHSMGGGAAVLAAASDPGLALLVGLAPAETNPSAAGAAASVTAPTLVLSGSRDCVTPFASHAGPILAALASTSIRHVDIAGGSHCQFSDGYFTCSIGENSCGGSATIPAVDQHAVTVTEIRRLLDEVLAAQQAEFADGFED
jgi:pimeloyl-ACP methyl ester carboxylesterase